MILAIDQGTTGTTCLVFDREGRIRGRAYSEFGQHFPRPGWVEHDANEIWEVTRRVASRGARRREGSSAASLDAIGITNQRETVVAWDPRTGEPVHNALVWQDRRTAARCDELREAGHEQLVRERTGLVLDPYFSGTKIEWLLRKRRRRRATRSSGRSTRGSSFKLTGRHATDFSNASRTMLFDIGQLRWDPELCDLLGVDPERLPEPLPSAEVYGHHLASSAARSRSPGSPATSRRRCSARPAMRPGMAKNTYGTGSFVLLNAGAQTPRSRARAC